jgi:hypothetical protein
MRDPKTGLSGHFDRLFKSERSWLVKLAGASVFGLATAGQIVWWNRNGFSISAKLYTLAAVPVLVMLGAGALLRADAVRRQLRAGNRIGPFSRLIFGAGIWSLLIWVVLALFIGFPVAIWIGAMTSDRPAG